MDELLIFNQLMIVEHWGGGIQSVNHAHVKLLLSDIYSAVLILLSIKVEKHLLLAMKVN